MFKETGSVKPMPPKPKQSNQKRLEAQIQLKTMIADPTSFSTRKAACALGMSHTTILSILHDDFHFKAYKYHFWHKLEEHDYEKRVILPNGSFRWPPELSFFFYFSDEAYFYLTLLLNKQNNRIWSGENPFQGIELPLYDKKLLVWCAISRVSSDHTTLKKRSPKRSI